VCVCSLSYPAHKAHAPYCHLWPVRLYFTLPHYLMNGTVFGKKNMEHNLFVIFSTNCLKTFLILRRIQRDINNVRRSSFLVIRYCCVIAMGLELSRLVSSYQLNAQFLYSITIYMLHYNLQHVSSSTLLIFRR